ncbi:hypothetical protein PanWU01x14_133510 [Parasponia andersonii]|uniref:Uncharacterized protein n=1 Tax=Parasponia andersonii TaxID=3476 RepID=A0A2P5CPV1_PARAD|nr:hypothetical protein PanWU01x14_133510 [Parasponia andersonii]
MAQLRISQLLVLKAKVVIVPRRHATYIEMKKTIVRRGQQIEKLMGWVGWHSRRGPLVASGLWT